MTDARTDAPQQTFQHRIADLLDDVTETSVTANVAANVTANVAAGVTAETPVLPKTAAPDQLQPIPTPDASKPAAAPFVPAPPASAPPAAAPLPQAEEIPSLPPFLAQTGSTASTGGTPADQRSLPGTALFGSTAARTAAKAEQPAQPIQPAPAADGALPPPAAAPTPGNGQPLEAPGEATATLETPIPVAAAALAAEAAAAQPAAPAASPGPPISIKGRADGLVVEIGKGSWSEILATLDDRLQQSASFFRNARVAVDLGARAVTEAEMTPLLDLLKTHGLTPGAVRTSSERTFQTALAIGLTTTLESAEGATVADAAAAATNASVGAYFVYRGYLRSGHRLQRKESILVIGDINPGAEVNSEGDVLVWGRLRGVVHAGSAGNARAIVAALDLEPTQLRIAHVMTVGPDPRPGQPGKWFWRRSANKRPEIARIVNEEISLEEWDATRPGGLVSLRRGG